ncbi:Reverse transcriptase [Theobroma cacao]|nr:Reverse transcriptase [Theobroma cacao]
MQEELDQFKRNRVWSLVSRPLNHPIVGKKLVFRNKVDEQGNIVRNEARIVAQGYNQEEGIDYDETFASVARIEAIRLLLTFACFMNFKLYQMDVKSAFLNGFIQEEVFVEQPLGFEDFEKLDHVFKLHKALYGLKQAPRACASLVKEFYSSIVVDKDELEEPDDFSHEGLNVFLNGKEFTVTAADLGELLKIECNEGELEFPEKYDPSSLLEMITGKKEKYSSKSNVGLIISPQIRILHYFVAANLHGRNGSLSYISLQDLWLMEHAFSGVALNLGKFMIERMRGACRLEKINLPYEDIVTSLVQNKGIWSFRYEADKVKIRDQAIYLGSLPKMGYKLNGERYIKTPKLV